MALQSKHHKFQRLQRARGGPLPCLPDDCRRPLIPSRVCSWRIKHSFRECWLLMPGRPAAARPPDGAEDDKGIKVK